MGVAVAVRQPELSVAPGAEAVTELRIRNTGDVVDQIELDILGDAAGWATVEPQRVNLLPGHEATARVVFAPPRSPKIAAGETPYAVRAMSREDTAGSVIEEASVTVEPFGEIVAEIVPRTSRGSRQGRHQLAIDNLGNRAAEVSIVATDPDRLLDFRLQQSAITAVEGTATFLKLTAIPRKRFLKGAEKTLPFEVVVAAEGTDPVTVQAALLQRALVPPWFLKAVLAALAALVAFAVLWSTVLKPEVKSTAKEVAIAETAEAKQIAQEAKETADKASGQADAAAKAAGVPEGAAAAGAAGGRSAGSGASGKSGTGAATTPGAAAAGGPGTAAGASSPAEPSLDPKVATSVRLVATGGPSTDETTGQDSTYTPAAGMLFWVSDILLQNPAGDDGTLRIKRGTEILFEFGLANFRDLDYHLLQPLRFAEKEPLVVTVACGNTTGDCTPSILFTGRLLPDPAAKKN